MSCAHRWSDWWIHPEHHWVKSCVRCGRIDKVERRWSW